MRARAPNAIPGMSKPSRATRTTALTLNSERLGPSSVLPTHRFLLKREVCAQRINIEPPARCFLCGQITKKARMILSVYCAPLCTSRSTDQPLFIRYVHHPRILLDDGPVPLATSAISIPVVGYRGRTPC